MFYPHPYIKCSVAHYHLSTPLCTLPEISFTFICYPSITFTITFKGKLVYFLVFTTQKKITQPSCPKNCAILGPYYRHCLCILQFCLHGSLVFSQQPSSCSYFYILCRKLASKSFLRFSLRQVLTVSYFVLQQESNHTYKAFHHIALVITL